MLSHHRHLPKWSQNSEASGKSQKLFLGAHDSRGPALPPQILLLSPVLRSHPQPQRNSACMALPVPRCTLGTFGEKSTAQPPIIVSPGSRGAVASPVLVICFCSSCSFQIPFGARRNIWKTPGFLQSQCLSSALPSPAPRASSPRVGHNLAFVTGFVPFSPGVTSFAGISADVTAAAYVATLYRHKNLSPPSSAVLESPAVPWATRLGAAALVG